MSLKHGHLAKRVQSFLRLFSAINERARRRPSLSVARLTLRRLSAAIADADAGKLSEFDPVPDGIKPSKPWPWFKAKPAEPRPAVEAETFDELLVRIKEYEESADWDEVVVFQKDVTGISHTLFIVPHGIWCKSLDLI